MLKLEINPEKIRLWAVLAAVQTVTFGMGMYTAKTYWSNPSVPIDQLDYSTNELNQQSSRPSEAKPGESARTTDSLDPANCTAIKGNISGSNKTYHVPGGSFYERTTTPEMCFATETEAQAAGFKKASR